MTAILPQDSSIPAHVPENLVFDFDLYDGPGLNGAKVPDVHALWKRFQDERPDVFWTPRNGGHWVLTRHEVIREVALNPKQFSSRDIFVPQGTSPFLTPTNSDAPLHSKYRLLMNPYFAPASLARVTGAARVFAIELIENLRPKGRCEFVGDFSSIMPVMAFMALVNLPQEDLGLLLGIAKRMSPNQDSNEQAWLELSDYVRGQLDRRRTKPQDDFMSHMLEATIDGRKLTDEEIFSMSLLVVSGGLDTVAISIGFAASFLAQNPAHRHELIEHPDRIENAINEMLRRFGVSNIARVAAEDSTVAGVNIRAGESVLMMYPLAGLDDRVHEDPLRLDFQRKNPEHLVFGTGPHTCLGNRLGKRELRLFLEEWLKRIPDFELAPGTAPKASCGVTNHLEELQLVWNV